MVWALRQCTRIWVRAMIGLLKMPLSIFQSAWEKIRNSSLEISLSPLGVQNESLDAVPPTSLTEVKITPATQAIDSLKSLFFIHVTWNISNRILLDPYY